MPFEVGLMDEIVACISAKFVLPIMIPFAFRYCWIRGGLYKG